MDFKGFYDEIIFDVDRPILKSYTGKQGDTKSRGLYVTVTQKNAVIDDLTGLSMRLFYEKPDKTRGFIDGVVDGSKFRIDYTNQVYAVPGVVKAELRLMGADGEIITAKTFKILVDSSIADGSIVSENERGILDRAFELAEDIIPRLELLDVELLEDVQDEMLGARHSNTKDETYENLGDRLDAAEQDLLNHKAEYTSNRQQDQLKVARVEKELNDYKATMQQVNINQEPKQKTTGYGVISLPPNAANGQVSVSVKGQTLKNELNYNRDTYAEWTVSAGVTKSMTGIEITGASQFAYIGTNVKQVTKYGILYNVVSSDLDGELRIGTELTGTVTAIPRTVGNQKVTITTRATISSNRFSFTTASAVTAGKKIKISDVRLFELPTGSEIENDFNTMTADQLAIKYPYIQGDSAKSTIGAVRIKSVGKNLFDKNRALKGYILNFTNGVPQPYSTPSFCSDFIRVDSNEQYYVTGFLGKGYTFIAFYDSNKIFTRRTLASVRYNIPISDIQDHEKYIRITVYDIVNNPATWQDIDDVLNNLQVKRGNVATPYEPYRESNVYITAKNEAGSILELRSLPNGVKDEINVTDRKLIKRIGEKTNVSNGTVINYTDMAENGTYYAWNENGETETGVKGDTLGIDATTLIYQLAKPVEIPIQVSGSIVSYPSGTIYIERILPDAGVYTDKISVLHQDAPIKRLDRLSKVDFYTGVETELDVSEAVIAEDKLSFTHPDLSEGDIVFFEYEYDLESTQGETEIEYYDSRYVVKDSVTDKFYKWHIIVADGVPSIELVEV